MPKRTQRDENLGRATGAGRRGDAAKEQKHAKHTRGTNRDFDETGEADNSGHGHPREEREQRGREN
jgi:hypothetical protein